MKLPYELFAFDLDGTLRVRRLHRARDKSLEKIRVARVTLAQGKVSPLGPAIYRKTEDNYSSHPVPWSGGLGSNRKKCNPGAARAAQARSAGTGGRDGISRASPGLPHGGRSHGLRGSDYTCSFAFVDHEKLVLEVNDLMEITSQPPP